jgi:hypothetical protein
MKHLKIFESFTHLNEGSSVEVFTTDSKSRALALEKKEADAARAIERLKYMLLKYGISGLGGVESAKSISWTKTEISELVKKSEDNFDEMKVLIKEYDDNEFHMHLGKKVYRQEYLKKEDMDKMRVALMNRTKTLNAIKDLPVR